MGKSAERMRRHRERKKASHVTGVTASHVTAKASHDVTVTPESVTGGVTVVMGVTLTESDKLFEVDRPGWYIFGKRVWERICWKCGKDFCTHLELGRFCCPLCKN